MKSKIGVSCIWTLRERDRRTGLVIAERQTKNLWTTYGLTALAQGLLDPDNVYLAVENPGITVYATISAGVGSVTLSAQADMPGDTKLVLSVGGIHEETVEFSSSTDNGDGTFTYTLVGTTTQPHTSGDFACRAPSEGDTVSSLMSEQQYDATNFPGLRSKSPGNYSGGSGNAVFQFFFAGPTLLTDLILVGMCDSPSIGSGNLYNHFSLGHTHSNSGNDLEVDGSLTLSNI